MRTIICMIALTSMVFAGNLPTKFKTDVNIFLDRANENNTLPHRSGLVKVSTPPEEDEINTSSVLSLYDDILEDKINRKKLDQYEYEVSYEQPDSAFNGLFKSFSKETNLSKVYFDTLYQALIFIPVGDEVFNVSSHYRSNQGNSKNDIEKYALEKVHTLLGKFKGRIEFDRTDVTYQNGTDIVNMDVRFRRIFQNGIVLDDISSIIVSVNGEREITSIRIKWPKFRKIDTINRSFPYSYCKDAAFDIISQQTYAQKDGDTIHATNAEICGVAQAWHSIKSNDGKKIISPCLSFESHFTMENGEQCTYFLNVPILNKYYIKNQ
jgi:hypothetical protein